MSETTDLERAYKALANKQAGYNLAFAYYDGNQPLLYSTDRLRELFRTINVKFSQNWCAVVVDAVADRLNLARFTVADNERATQLLNELWTSTELHADSDDAHLAALVTGEAYVIAWRGDDGRVEAYYNDPRLCHLFYDPERPREKRYAAKWWTGEDGRLYMTLYYPDRLEYYVSRGKAENVSSAAAFVPAEVPFAENPFGKIPVFHLRRDRRIMKSELVNVISLQDAINKLLADMMVAAEFGAFRQRWIISNADVDRLKNAPNEIWSIPAGDEQGQHTQVGEFEQTDLSGYLDAIDRLANSVAVITRTPKQYLLRQGGDPSGEALIAMESPLVKKCARIAERFSITWRRLAAFMLELSGVSIDESAIEPVYDPIETVQPRTQAEIRQISTQAGLPLRTILRQFEGWSDAQLQKMEQDQEMEQAAAQTSLAAALVESQRRFDQGGGGNGRVGEGAATG